MTQPIQISTGNPGDARSVASLLALAFHHDPVSSWVFPDSTNRRRQHPLFFRTFVDHALMWGEVNLCHTTGYSGAALWSEVNPRDPGVDDMPVFRGVLDPDAFGRFTILLSAMEAVHPSDLRYAYLTFIGVSPNEWGRGIGRALLEHKLGQLRETGTPAYLEASSERSRRLYLRLGFRDLPRRIELPDGPTLFPMWWSPDADPMAAQDRAA